jgi:hypothetical protein
MTSKWERYNKKGNPECANLAPSRVEVKREDMRNHPNRKEE